MTASQKAAASWPLLTFALWACCLLQIRCEPAAPQPIDAGAPAVLDMSASPLPDLMPVAPACVPCSWTETINDCSPSRCARSSGGMLCCVRSGVTQEGLPGDDQLRVKVRMELQVSLGALNDQPPVTKHLEVSHRVVAHDRVERPGDDRTEHRGSAKGRPEYRMVFSSEKRRDPRFFVYPFDRLNEGGIASHGVGPNDVPVGRSIPPFSRRHGVDEPPGLSIVGKHQSADAVTEGNSVAEL